MPSRFWTFIANLTPGETARAAEVNAKFLEIDGALANVSAELNRAVRYSGDSPTPLEAYMQVPNTPAQRANRVLGFNAAGAPTITSATWNYRQAWVPATLYNSNDIVLLANDGLYISLLTHTAAALFATDLAASRWLKIVDLAEVSRAIRKFQIVTSSLSPFTATAGDDLMVDVSTAPVTIRLPAAPTINDQAISIVHIDGSISSNNITVDRNGNRIMGLTENMFVTDANAAFELAYCDTLRGWRLSRGT